MKTLNETQMQALHASAKDDGASLEGHHPRTVASLVKQGLVAKRRDRGGRYRLVATPAGKALLHKQLDDASQATETNSVSDVPEAPNRVTGSKQSPPRTAGSSTSRPQSAQPTNRTEPNTATASASASAQPPAVEAKGKLGLLIGLLCRPEGGTLEAMMAATGWQAHSVRGAMAGAIKKKLGLTVTSEKFGSIRCWRIIKTRP